MVKNVLNDPEYRWYHKEEMSKIMPFPTERKRLGIKVLDYDALRNENDKKIKVCSERFFSWDRLRLVVDVVPKGLDKLEVKESFSPKDRLHFERRDRGVCDVCWQVNYYGSNNPYSSHNYNSYFVSQLHHVIPNGKIEDSNVITLCVHCHQMVHQALFLLGKWKFARPI